MSEHIIDNANDVTLTLTKGTGDGSTTVDTSGGLGRLTADEFSITKEEDDSLISGLGRRRPDGVTFGDITFNWSFTIMGTDVELFKMIATEDGVSEAFSFSAKKTADDGTLEWEYALEYCITTSEEMSASSGDAVEYAVEGIAVRMDKDSDTVTNWSHSTATTGTNNG